MKLKKKITLKKGSVERYADTEEALAKLKKMGYKEVDLKTTTSTNSNVDDTSNGSIDKEKFNDYSYQELQGLAKEMGLKASGSKDELIERIVAEKVSVKENTTEGSDEDKK